MTVPHENLRRTALFDRHREAGAKLVPFAGWEMPVQYADGIRAEHQQVRMHAGIFDVSHMGEIETAGPQAAEFLQHILSNDVSKLEIGGAQYSLLCQQDGGVIDDLFTYRLGPQRYLTVTNASNHETDYRWFAQQAGGFDVDVIDRANEYAMIALQGPEARGILRQLLGDGAEPARMTVVQSHVAGHPALICGTGYTGEDGVEILLPPANASSVWEDLIIAGAKPVGLAARDTLRLEVCFHLYGNDLSRDRDPISAGLGWACALETGFIGADALKKIRDAGPEQVLVPFRIVGPGIPRQDNPVFRGGRQIGVVTSGTLSPSLDNGVGMAYLDKEFSDPGTDIEIDIRGKLRPAQTRKKPLYAKQ
ncbi:MAG: glycine cleavage system aminomethyltransferase GcvT [Thermoleophilaceae bacterium]|nr:glycine cleavage system aminomethyltransferase GcvT [Thermoleophilaceae bacterium]